KQIRIGKPQYGNPRCLRQRPAVHKRRIAEVHEPVEIVVNGVIDPAFVLTTVSQVERCNARVIYERRAVGAGSESANSKIRALTRIAANIRRSTQDSPRLHSLPELASTVTY